MSKQNKEKVEERTEVFGQTDDELKQLAKDLWANNIFTDRHVPEHDKNMIGSIFMPIMLGGINKELLKKIGLIYEYHSEAGPRAINGYPCFFSVRYLSIEDTKKMFGYYDKIKQAMEIAPDVNSSQCVWCEKKYTYTDEEKAETPWIEKFCKEECSIEFQAFRNRKKL